MLGMFQILQEITYNEKFKLFMQTKLSNPHYPPEIQAQIQYNAVQVHEDGVVVPIPSREM